MVNGLRTYSVFLESKRQVCLLPSIIAIMSDPGQRLGRLITHYRRSGILSREFISCNVPNSVYRHHLALFAVSCGNGGSHLAQMLTLWLVLLPYIMISFSDPRISCLLILSMKLWQASLLACMKGKISNISKCLTTLAMRMEW